MPITLSDEDVAELKSALEPFDKFLSLLTAARECRYIKKFNQDTPVASLVVSGSSEHIRVGHLMKASTAMTKLSPTTQNKADTNISKKDEDETRT